MQANTCFEECRFRDKKGKYKKTCPDYMELSWTSDSSEVCITEDCAKRRTLLMLLGFDARMIGVQQASEEERNSNHKVVDKLVEIVDIATTSKKNILIDNKI